MNECMFRTRQFYRNCEKNSEEFYRGCSVFPFPSDESSVSFFPPAEDTATVQEGYTETPLCSTLKQHLQIRISFFRKVK